MNIDYSKIAHAVVVATNLGFELIEVPWIVPSTSLTRPPESSPILVSGRDLNHNGELIGSAEQGFLSLHSSLKANQRYVSVSPCFRDEAKYVSGITEPWFIKVELFVPLPKFKRADGLIDVGRRIMRTWTRNLVEITTESGVDLMLNDVEVGSYGYRETDSMCWLYGTGLAEPRFSTALAAVPA